jgi:hypothetical protein
MRKAVGITFVLAGASLTVLAVQGIAQWTYYTVTNWYSWEYFFNSRLPDYTIYFLLLGAGLFLVHRGMLFARARRVQR